MARLPGESERLPVARASVGVARPFRDPVGPALAGAGSDLFSAGMNLQTSIERERLRIDTAAEEDAFNKFRMQQIELTVGENGFTKQRSGDAVTKPILKNYTEQLDRVSGDIEKNLTSDRQKEGFRRRTEVAKQQFTKDLLIHLDRENTTYQKQTMDATIDTEKNVAALHWNVKGDIDGSIVRAKKSIDGFAETADLDEKAKSVLYREATTKIHRAVIERAINEGRSGYAAEWLKQNREEIDSDTARLLQASLKTAGTREASQQQADRIWATGKSPADMTTAARKIRDPEVRQSTLALVKARIAEEDGYQKLDQNNAYDEAQGYLAYEQTQGRVPTLNDIPQTTLERMSGAQQAAILRTLGGVKPVKGGQTYYTLEQMHADDEQAFMDLDLNQFDGQITPEEKVRFIGYQKDTATGGPMGEIARTKSQIIKQGITASGLDIKEMDKGDDEIAFQRRIDAEAEALGRDVTATDLRDIVDRLTIEVIRERDYIWDVTAPAGMTTVEGVPDDMVDELARAVEAAGQPVTHENIRKLYGFENR